MLTLKAPAKINLTLEVMGRRPDGYHDIATVLQAIDLSDTLTFEPAADVTLECNWAHLVRPDNLVLKAARLLQSNCSVRQGARIHLEKRIPEAAGLGGGSSDAATALKGLAQLWGLSLKKDSLLESTRSLGSDVAFFIEGGTALATGRGDQIASLPSLPQRWAVILKPPLAMEGKTGKMYGALKPADFTGGEAAADLAKALERGENPDASLFFNCFEPVAARLLPELESYRRRFLAAGAPWVHLAGAGPSYFTLLETPEKAGVIWERLRDQSLESYLATTL